MLLPLKSEVESVNSKPQSEEDNGLSLNDSSSSSSSAASKQLGFPSDLKQKNWQRRKSTIYMQKMLLFGEQVAANDPTAKLAIQRRSKYVNCSD